MASIRSDHRDEFSRYPLDASMKERQHLFVTGLKNMHAVEKEAIQILKRQIERTGEYPEVQDKLRSHLTETEGQERRLMELLEGLGESRSIAKDSVGTIMGNLAAMAHAPAPDEILKNTFANHAFENYEIAAYKSLITMGEAIRAEHCVDALQESLGQEEAMAKWILENTPKVTQMYMDKSCTSKMDYDTSSGMTRDSSSSMRGTTTKDTSRPFDGKGKDTGMRGSGDVSQRGFDTKSKTFVGPSS